VVSNHIVHLHSYEVATYCSQGHEKRKSAQTPDGKPGRELAQRAEGFSVLTFWFFCVKTKEVAPAAMSGTEHFIKMRIFLLRNEASYTEALYSIEIASYLAIVKVN
jgi:hypothetical protein